MLSGMLAVLLLCFQQGYTDAELRALHPEDRGPLYHDLSHSKTTSQLIHQLTGDRFLAQVALIHDVDPNREVKTPARVPATLEWMDANKADLIRRFGWETTPGSGERRFLMAKAIIQRTCFPFDMNARPSYRDWYRQGGPAVRYLEMLRPLTAAEQRYVLRNAAILSEYADKLGGYTRTPFQSLVQVKGLSRETGLNFAAQAKGTLGFIRSLGSASNFALDFEMARQLRVDLQIPALSDMLRKLTPEQRRNFELNVKQYEKFAAGRDPARALRTLQIADQAKGTGYFVVGWLGKEALKSLESERGLQHLPEAAQQLKEPMFWGSFGAFAAGSTGADLALRRAGFHGATRRVLPLVAGMAASQALSGQVSPERLVLGSAAFLGASAGIDAFFMRAIPLSGNAGRLARVGYTAAKITLTLYAGEKIEAAALEALQRR